MSFDHSQLTIEQLNNMSEDDFSKLDLSQFPDDPTLVDETPEVDPDEQVQEQEVEVTPTTTEEAEQPNEGVTTEAAAEGEGTQEVTVPNEGGEAVEQPTTQEQPTNVEVSAEKAFFDKVTTEFQANGRAFKVDSAEDVVSLMQKGLNYNQKMAAMKPGMKVLKALEAQGITSVEQLGYLLDLQAKKPEAIAKLIQDSGLDTYELNEEKAQTYQPTVPHVSDKQIELDMVLSGLNDNPHFGTLVKQLDHYDDVTKQELFDNPNKLNILTEHVANGYYDQITNRMAYEQSVGRLQGMPFLQAYNMIGEAMFGGNQPAPTPPVTQPVVQPIVQPVATPVTQPVAQKANPSNNAARQAAASAPATSAAAPKQTYTQEQIWNMSEEEFLKIDKKFL